MKSPRKAVWVIVSETGYPALVAPTKKDCLRKKYPEERVIRYVLEAAPAARARGRKRK